MNSTHPKIKQDDEISLIELGLILWEKKFLITGVTVCFIIIAIAYAFLAAPVWQVQSILKTTPIKNLAPINSSGIFSISPIEALEKVGAKLDSYDTRLRFFQENKDLFESLRQPNETLEQSFERFNRKAFTVLQPDLKSNPHAIPYRGISLQYSNGLDGVNIVNKFIAFAINEEKEEIESNYNALLNHKILHLENELIAKRAQYEFEVEALISQLTEDDALMRAQLFDELNAVRNQLERNRENRMQRLQEAISIATALGISKPTSPTLYGRIIQETPSFYAELSNQSPPLYFMGTEALQAELDVLLARESDDFTSSRISEIKKELQILEQNRQVELLKSRQNKDLFIKERAALKKELTHLENLFINFDTIQIVHIDQYAHTPHRPIKPNKKLILAIGSLLGLMTGIFIALIIAVFQKHKKTSH